MRYYMDSISGYVQTEEEWEQEWKTMPEDLWGERNFDDLPTITALSEKYDVPICPYGISEHMSPVHCGSTCDVCMHQKHVLFLEHGSLAKKARKAKNTA